MTCVHCYNAYEGNGAGHKNKCIWRRCRAPRNPDEVAAEVPAGDAACQIIPKDATESTNEKDEHDAECFVCGEGGGESLTAYTHSQHTHTLTHLLLCPKQRPRLLRWLPEGVSFELPQTQNTGTSRRRVAMHALQTQGSGQEKEI